MFLGLDHITYNVASIEDASGDWLNSGYSSVFCESNLLNHPQKAVCLNNFSSHHSLTLLKPEQDGTPWVELTSHGPVASTKAPLDLQGELIWLTTVEPELEQNFWQALLKVTPKGESGVTFKASLPRYSFKLAFKSVKEENNYTLDSQGYTCLAFLVTNIRRDGQKLLTAGGSQVTDLFDLTVGGQSLRLAFFQSPSKVFIELIEVRKEASE